MSYLIDILSSAQGGQLVANLAQRFGLSPDQVEKAVISLSPALEIGLHNAAHDPSVFSKVIGALASPDHQASFDHADAAHAHDTVSQSRDLLSELFGSPAVAGQVVQVAARDSGLRPDILSQLLPVLASVVLGGLFKNMNNQGLGGVLGQLAGSGALGSILEQVLGGGRAAPQPQQPTPMPRQGGGGLGGLLGGILGSLLGGARQGGGMSGGLGGGLGGGMGGGMGGGANRGGPLDVDADGRAGPAGLPDGLDQSSLQQAIEQIKNQLQIGKGGVSNAGPAGGGSPGAGGTPSDIESILGQLLGRR